MARLSLSQAWYDEDRGVHAMEDDFPRPKSYPGFRRCVARLLSPIRRLPRMEGVRVLLLNTGYEGGSFLQDIFNAWDTYRIEGSGADAWVLAWDVVHDAIISALDGGDEELSRKLMSLRPV